MGTNYTMPTPFSRCGGYSIALLAILVLLLQCSCNRVGDDDLWREKVEVENDTYVDVYHVASCSKPKPLFTPTEKILDYRKYKYDVFCHCISDEMADVLNEISKKNIKEYSENALCFAEDACDFERYQAYMRVFDFSARTYEVDSGIKGRQIVALRRTFWVK